MVSSQVTTHTPGNCEKDALILVARLSPRHFHRLFPADRRPLVSQTLLSETTCPRRHRRYPQEWAPILVLRNAPCSTRSLSTGVLRCGLFPKPARANKKHEAHFSLETRHGGVPDMMVCVFAPEQPIASGLLAAAADQRSHYPVLQVFCGTSATMSELEQRKDKHVSEEKPAAITAAGSDENAAAGAADAASAGAAAGDTGGKTGDEGKCTLVAKWQGSTIELPVLPKTTTIGEVKVSDPSILRRKRFHEIELGSGSRDEGKQVLQQDWICFRIALN